MFFHMARMQAGNLDENNTNMKESKCNTERETSEHGRSSTSQDKLRVVPKKWGHFCHMDVVLV